MVILSVILLYKVLPQRVVQVKLPTLVRIHLERIQPIITWIMHGRPVPTPGRRDRSLE